MLRQSVGPASGGNRSRLGPYVVGPVPNSVSTYWNWHGSRDDGVFGLSRKRRRRVHDPDELHRLDDLDEPDDDADDTMADVVPGRITARRPAWPRNASTEVVANRKVRRVRDRVAHLNGIMSIFVCQAVAAFTGKTRVGTDIVSNTVRASWLCTCAHDAHSFLSLFNPRPILTVSSASVPLGKTIRVGWQFTGRTGSMRHLKIEVQGKEVAEYRRGTSGCTDTEKFATIPVVDTEDPFQMETGELTVSMPSNTMHWFEAPHNKSNGP